MTVSETLTRKAALLSLSRQLEVLDFVEFLQHKQEHAGARRDPEGLLQSQSSHLSLEDFAKARHEAWDNFPRNVPQ